MSGCDLIAAERERQIAEEGWTPEHDDTHDHDELALAASCYTLPHRLRHRDVGGWRGSLSLVFALWPWGSEWWKPVGATDIMVARSPDGESLTPYRKSDAVAARTQELVKAGALIAAEIDRLQRIEERA